MKYHSLPLASMCVCECMREKEKTDPGPLVSGRREICKLCLDINRKYLTV